MTTEHELLSVLLVEDNPANVFLQKRIITKLGCAGEITVATTGLEAFEMVKDWRDAPDRLPDLIFLDINLPAMNGWEFMDHYNDLEIPAELRPVVLILTYSEYSKDRKRAKKTPGVMGFYNKPLTVPLLESILQRYFPELAAGS
ncbi:CheY-like chemotaxis protein [Lewinella marina]|uniref:Response regulator n=1 Tax=Neolewinella marina TaxID=438751 RepID=A0A2G0CKG2_9BACT|nr:response regulator [Neolewinella marina]NJB84346.1 CheY-like chemotaxis protein [Neolewinella marina]PHL00455.1 response regulator [Neolewinella marina]